MAVAPLTINYDRERVVKFTKPYMNFGIGILYHTPRVSSPSLFGFMSPLSPLIWILVIVAYVSVAIVMFFISRFVFACFLLHILQPTAFKAANKQLFERNLL